MKIALESTLLPINHYYYTIIIITIIIYDTLGCSLTIIKGVIDPWFFISTMQGTTTPPANSRE